jgi:DNA primase
MDIQKPDIIQTIEQAGIELKRGKSLCPFHAERTPSFIVNQKKQTFHCYGCGEHGDVIDFIRKLHGLSFKDALVYLGIKNGKPVRVDPAITRQKKIQKDYETAINNLWEKLCEHSRYLHKLKLKVKTNPGSLSEQGATSYAGLMGELAQVDFKLNTLIEGSFEDKIFLLRGNGDAYRSREFKQRAVG